MTNEGERAIYSADSRTCYLVGTRLRIKEFQVACLLELREGEDILDLVWEKFQTVRQMQLELAVVAAVVELRSAKKAMLRKPQCWL